MEKKGDLKVVGTVTYTAFDGYKTTTTFALDANAPPLLWRSMEVGRETVEMKGEACVALSTAVGQLDAYRTKFAKCVTGDCEAIAKTLTDAAPADPFAIRESEKAAEQAAVADADY